VNGGLQPGESALDELNADPADDAAPPRRGRLLPVVGLGGCAGSLEALRAFFEAAPADTGMAFVVVLHPCAAPERAAVLDMLRAATRMPVLPVDARERMQADTVHVVAPGSTLRLRGDRIEPVALPSARGAHTAIDMFFRALADTHGPSAAAVVLSGRHEDAAIGLKRIKERGGLTIAQAPQEARHAAMVQACIATGMVDWTLPVGEMAARIAAYRRLEGQLRLPAEQLAQDGGVDMSPAARDEESSFKEVMAFLRHRTGRDFAHYKRATVLRRIGRRMQVNGVSDLAAYLDCLRTRPGEAGALQQDMLVSVTNFFRDAACFEALEARLPTLFAGKTATDTVRVWVAACATGEEAYSVAMLLSEHAQTLASPPAVQVFATDLNEEAIRVAREGIYSSAAEADLAADRLRRFFVREPRGWRVRRELRETVLFAVHDVLKDSPFARIDLACCRNLLIYLDRQAQAKVLAKLHFSLQSGGLLFLGPQESAEDQRTLFSAVDAPHGLHVQQDVPRPALPALQGTVRRLAAAPLVAGEVAVPLPRIALPPFAGTRAMSWAELHLKLLDRLGPPSILLDAGHEMLHISPAATAFLHFSGGEPTRNVLRAIVPELRAELQTALYQAHERQQPLDVAPVPVRLGGRDVEVALQVVPVDELGGALLVLLRSSEAAAALGEVVVVPRADPASVAGHLEREVERLKWQLRETVEQYETSTEELKASNEELHAMNEELQSATEELETSREELQSINEEITTVNQELKSRVDDLGQANSDMLNLMDATAIATVFLDRAFRVTRFTPSAAAVFKLIAADVGRPLSDLATSLDYPELPEDAHRVLETLLPCEREVGDDQGTWYLARLRPYRTIEDRIAGVVLSFVDITERKAAEAALRESEERLRLMLENAVDYAIFSVDMARRVTSWNTGAQRLLGYSEPEILGRSADIIFTEEDRAAGAPDDEAGTALAAGRAADDRQHQRKDGSRFWASGALMPMHNGHGAVIGMVKVLRDQSEQRAAQQALELSRAELLDALRANEAARKALEVADAAKDRFLAVLSHELRNPLASISGAAQLLAPESLPTPDQARAARVIQRQASAMKVLLGDLLDVSSLRMGRLALRRERVTAQAIVEAAVEATRPLMELGRHTFELDLCEDEVWLDADPMRLTQVLSNLLSNSAKYTPDHGVIVLSVRADAVAREAVFTVTDNGIGMEPDTVQAMFEMFTQSVRSHDRAAGGLGIGLALVRSIVELHSGSVTGESAGSGHGSRFTVRIPLACSEAQAAEAGRAASLPAPGPGQPPAAQRALRVLLADDNADALWGMARVLSIAGFDVETAGNGIDALRIAEAFRPDAAVLDVDMPGLDGHEVARRIRSHPWGRAMLLVAATGWSQPEDKQMALAAGFDEHLVKPVALGDVQRLLRNWRVSG
jgi:two-component system CheB/CheR fusion protein